ncbi:Na/Pi cotransporter family protein [Fictibacillus iocasae]|uniref:Na/Pi cotransporter family protein n=1 Tax=Fictibacillus iocasae TaxID=2715437 RepID=A0ABW2NI78_9BACL
MLTSNKNLWGRGAVFLGIQEMIFQFAGGLGIFLFGIKYMGEGLQNTAGDRLRDILDRFTANPFMGLLAGIFVTILIQSSSGTTVLTVGLVNAGFMTLRQSIGVIMGANIGTTITSFIIGVDVGEYALPIMAIGSVLIFFFKKAVWTHIGQVMFGFGCLFLGLELMGKGVEPLQYSQAFKDMTLSMGTSPLLGIFAGTIITIVVQSSSATIGILQELYAQDLINLNAAVPILFGDNIGTTATAVLASIGASVAARRAAMVHVLFNVAGTIIFMLLLSPYIAFVTYLSELWGLMPAMQIAVAHGTFNVTNVLIQFPLIGLLAYTVSKLIRGEDHTIEFKAKHLDMMVLETAPVLALRQAKQELLRMAEFSKEGLKETAEYVFGKKVKNADRALKYEEAINHLDKQVTAYLVKLSTHPLTQLESGEHTMLLETTRDIERIGDHMENIVELVDYQIRNNISLTDDAMGNLDEMISLTLETLDQAILSIKYSDKTLAEKVLSLEEKIDKMERDLRKKHIIRVNEGRCEVSAGIVFVDIISNLERIGDHSVSLAEAVLSQ